MATITMGLSVPKLIRGELGARLHINGLGARSRTCDLGFGLHSVMLKLQNLPVTTREPVSDAKAGEFLLPSSSWGSHRYQHSSYREEP